MKTFIELARKARTRCRVLVIHSKWLATQFWIATQGLRTAARPRLLAPDDLVVTCHCS